MRSGGNFWRRCAGISQECCEKKRFAVAGLRLRRYCNSDRTFRDVWFACASIDVPACCIT